MTRAVGSLASSGLLVWLLPASAALHVLAFGVVPAARRTPPRAEELPPVELVAPLASPPPAPAPERPEPPEPAPAALPAPAPKPVAPPAAVAARAPAFEPEGAPGPALVDAVPVDFTSTMLSNAAESFPRSGVGEGAPGARAATSPAAALVVKRVVSSPSDVVPASALARPPRAPALDAELERNYPASARRAGVPGRAVLRVLVLRDGRLGHVRVVSETAEGFGVACERTVRSATWEAPVDRAGRFVSTEVTYVCRFEVRS